MIFFLFISIVLIISRCITMKSTLRKSVRIYKRRSVSDRYVEDGICLDKSFEDSSFQAVYQKISKEMKVSIIPEKKTDEEPKKFKT